MSSGEEKKNINCTHCGKRVPAMVYCIYCGSKLPKGTLNEETTKLNEFPRSPKNVTVSSSATISPNHGFLQSMNSVKNNQDLTSHIAKYCEMKISLLEFLGSGQVSERVFLKLYSEYSNKMNGLIDRQKMKSDEVKQKLEDEVKKLDKAKMIKEEIEVRHRIGELDTKTYTDKSLKLESEMKPLKENIRSFNENLKDLKQILVGKSQKDILDLELRAKTSKQSLEKMAEEGKISIDSIKIVEDDMAKLLFLLDSSVNN